MIDVQSVTKRYGDRVAVDDLSFPVRPGVVTRFLGPNGAGESTTIRMALGLSRPDAGEIPALFRTGEVEIRPDGAITTTGHDAEDVTRIAAAHGALLYELTPIRTSLEDAYLAMTEGDVEYAARTTPGRVA